MKARSMSTVQRRSVLYPGEAPANCHVRVGQLRVREKAESGDLRYRKLRGDQNPSDLLTKLGQ
eukprot:441201-Lingulodinium_polyedra.AAC.1